MGAIWAIMQRKILKMCKIDQWVSYVCYGQNKGGNNCWRTLNGPLAQLIREKKTSMHFGSLVMTFLNQLLILQRNCLVWWVLLLSLCSMTNVGWKAILMELMNEVWEVGRVLTQKPCLLDQDRVINIFLDQDTSLSCPQTSIVHFSYIKCVYQVSQV